MGEITNLVLLYKLHAMLLLWCAANPINACKYTVVGPWADKASFSCPMELMCQQAQLYFVFVLVHSMLDTPMLWHTFMLPWHSFAAEGRERLSHFRWLRLLSF